MRNTNAINVIHYWHDPRGSATRWTCAIYPPAPCNYAFASIAPTKALAYSRAARNFKSWQYAQRIKARLNRVTSLR